MSKHYDHAYFERWYRDPALKSAAIGGSARLARKVALAVATAEYHLERPIRSVLDIGCGEGAWRAPLRRLRPRVQYLGFESSEYERSVAPEVAAQPTGPRRKRRGWILGGREEPRPELRGAAHYGLINDPLPVRSPDANFDYRVTRDEQRAAAARRFTVLDKDKDGRIAWDELPTTRMQAELRRLK